MTKRVTHRIVDRDWVKEAVTRIDADTNRSSDTHMLKLELPAFAGIDLYMKDESTHITGSLKHRLARSLFLYAICNGWIGPTTPIIEASSGSTAVSEAYFAHLLGLRFIAVMPASTSREKIAWIEAYGGESHLVADPTEIYAESERLAGELDGHFMDQFTFAERATDWRGNNNIAESVFRQMAAERFPIPRWIVCGAGTGGTSATFGRYVRYASHLTDLCVVDPENSVFYDYYREGDDELSSAGSRIEGIGRPRVEPSFIPFVVDRMIKVPDAATIASIHVLAELTSRRAGGSTGTNLYGAFQLIRDMANAGEEGSIVMLICDGGERYEQTYYNETWLRDAGFDIAPYLEQLCRFHKTGEWVDV